MDQSLYPLAKQGTYKSDAPFYLKARENRNSKQLDTTNLIYCFRNMHHVGSFSSVIISRNVLLQNMEFISKYQTTARITGVWREYGWSDQHDLDLWIW